MSIALVFRPRPPNGCPASPPQLPRPLLRPDRAPGGGLNPHLCAAFGGRFAAGGSARAPGDAGVSPPCPFLNRRASRIPFVDPPPPRAAADAAPLILPRSLPCPHNPPFAPERPPLPPGRGPPFSAPSFSQEPRPEAKSTFPYATTTTTSCSSRPTTPRRHSCLLRRAKQAAPLSLPTPGHHQQPACPCPCARPQPAARREKPNGAAASTGARARCCLDGSRPQQRAGSSRDNLPPPPLAPLLTSWNPPSPCPCPLHPLLSIPPPPCHARRSVCALLPSPHPQPHSSAHTRTHAPLPPAGRHAPACPRGGEGRRLPRPRPNTTR